MQHLHLFVMLMMLTLIVIIFDLQSDGSVIPAIDFGVRMRQCGIKSDGNANRISYFSVAGNKMIWVREVNALGLMIHLY